MHIEHESPLPARSASTGMSLEGTSESSREGIWSSSGSFRKEAKSKYVSIEVNVGGGGYVGWEWSWRVEWVGDTRGEGERGRGSGGDRKEGGKR